MLLVEDYRPTLEAFRDALEDAGFEVRGVVDAADARDALAQQRYDVIVADYELSVVTGVEMLAALRGPMPRTPLILCSGGLTPLVEAEARRFGPFAVLGKPFPLDRLVAIVRAAVTRTPRLSL